MTTPSWMPPLPEPATSVAYIGRPVLGYYSPDQMRDYALAAYRSCQQSMRDQLSVNAISKALFDEMKAERDALLSIVKRVADILRGSEDEDQGAAYDNAQRVLDAAIDDAQKESKSAFKAWRAECMRLVDEYAEAVAEMERPYEWRAGEKERAITEKRAARAALEAKLKEQT